MVHRNIVRVELNISPLNLSTSLLAVFTIYDIQTEDLSGVMFVPLAIARTRFAVASITPKLRRTMPKPSDHVCGKTHETLQETLDCARDFKQKRKVQPITCRQTQPKYETLLTFAQNGVALTKESLKNERGKTLFRIEDGDGNIIYLSPEQTLTLAIKIAEYFREG